jgi:hypothetical protein
LVEAYTRFRCVFEIGLRKERSEATYNITNFLGFNAKTGINVNATTKRATAARLRPPKTRSRSHRLTVQLC